MELQELVLRVNILHSTIPDGYGSLGSWASMTTLDLAYNQFIGQYMTYIHPLAELHIVSPKCCSHALLYRERYGQKKIMLACRPPVMIVTTKCMLDSN